MKRVVRVDSSQRLTSVPIDGWVRVVSYVASVEAGYQPGWYLGVCTVLAATSLLPFRCRRRLEVTYNNKPEIVKKK